MATSTIARARIVPEAEWLSAGKELLKAEKQLTHQYNEVAQRRRELPWIKVEKEYVFEGPDGKETLSDLFDGLTRLITLIVSAGLR